MKTYPYLSTLEVNQDPYYRRISVSGFFNAIGQAVLTAAATSNPVAGAVKGGDELIKNTNSTISNAHRAFELILNGIEAACEELLKEQQLNCTQNDALLLAKRMGKEFQDIEIQITAAFFDAPQELTALQALKPVFVHWLEGIHLSNTDATRISEQLPHVFLRTVALEWGKQRAYYKPILEAFENPFTKAWEERYCLEAYYEELRGLFHQPALGDELLPLSKIYIEPDFLVYKKCIKPKYKNDYYNIGDNFCRSEIFQQSVHYYVNKWLNNETPLQLSGQNLLFILGQPGQGKSSFCYKMLADLLSDRNLKKTIYFIRLRDLSTEPDLIQKPFTVFKQYLEEVKNLVVDYKNSVLILDGLDELYMTGGITNQDLTTFYERLEHKVKRIQGFKILLTSRYNYLNVNAINTQVTTVLKLAPMVVEQQIQWLDIYKQAHSDCILTAEKLLEIEAEAPLKPIKELINQPILLHLIAKANVEIEADFNRATIYDKLFDAVVKREWDEGQLDKYHNINEQHLRAWLQEIAFAIHKSDKEYIYYNEIIALESSKALNAPLKTPEKMEEALKDLLVVFYFRNVSDKEKDRIYPIEFLHKSLQEYLAVEYMWNSILDLVETKPSDSAILKHFSELFAQKALNDNMKQMMKEIVQQAATEVRLLVRERLKEALPFCLEHQFLYAYSTAESGKRTPLSQMEACFKNFWLVLAHLVGEEATNNDLLEGEMRDKMATLLCVFDGVGMNLRGMNLGGVYLSGANLSRANLREADLSGADLVEADLSGANLREADLSGANLIEANLSGANLIEANLIEANLVGANLSGVNLMGANLIEADLVGANLSGVNLMGENLREAKTSALNFFQELEEQHCMEAKELNKHYYVDPHKKGYLLGIDKTYPYYLIKKRPNPPQP